MRKILIAAALLFSAAGCVQEGDYVTVMVPSEDGSETTATVSLSFDGAVDAGTRSVLGSGVDSKVSGGVVGVYNTATGLLDSEWVLDDFSSPVSMRLPKSAPMDIYVMGNLWHIDSAGQKVRLSFPQKEKDLAALVYMMNGAKVEAGRTETFADAARYGIPVAGLVMGVDPSKTSSVSVELRRLFAKVTLTIDHSGLDGGKSVDYFKNVALYLRQANVRLTPFASSSKSVSESDVVTKSDYDATMTNGRSLTFTYYVPENRHGEYPTYIEFSGKVDPSAGGYGGTVCYRFYIGSGEEGDYDVEGNQNYRVSLGFKAGSLFEPQWQVSRGEDWADGRRLCLAQDSAGSVKLTSNSVIAVRKGRAATCWLYYSRKGSGTNEASSLTACSGSFEPSDLTSSAWWCEAPDLAKNGIALTVSGNKLTFKVTDKSKFVAGRKIPVKIHLYPGDTVEEVFLTTFDDISVSVEEGKSLTDGFYIGMSRKVSVKGLAGSKIYYWNSNGVDRQALKATASVGADWIHNARSTAQTIPSGSALDLCAYNQTNGMQFSLKMVSNDTFNDGAEICNTDVIVKVPRAGGPESDIVLPFDGTSVEIPFNYLTVDDEVIPRSHFNDDIYEQILRPGVYRADGGDDTVLKWIGNDGMNVYLKNFYSGGVFIGDVTTINSGFLGPVCFGPSDRSLVFGPVMSIIHVRPPEWASPFQANIYSDYFNTKGASEITASADAYIYDGSSFIVERSGTNSSDVTVSVSPAAGSHNNVLWKFSDMGRTPDGLAPVGQQTVSLVFTHKVSGEKYRLASTFNVHHNITLRPFVLFTQGASTAEVLATTAKNAWILGRYCARESGVSKVTAFLGLSGATFSQYVTMKYNSATKKGSTTTAVYRGSCSMTGKYSYQDYDPSCYGKGYTWTSARISAFSSSGANALTYLGFCGPASTYTPVSTPLAASYVGGSAYVHLSASNSSLGCATLP